MKAELIVKPETQYFLATNDHVEDELLRKAFLGRIETNVKRTPACSQRTGIEEAKIDLYCLARCRKLLGSRHSSFAEIAEALSQHMRK